MRYSLKNKINHCYEKTWKPKAIPKPRTAKAWNNKSKPLYEHIKFHYSVVQDDICAYCRLPIRFGGYGEPVEHIVPKSLNPYWMFHPKNLCLACFACNTKKDAENTLVNDISTYPKKYEDYKKTSADYRIVHPHFDKFSDYIILVGFLYKKKPYSRGNKGQNTIDMCDLNRMGNLVERAKYSTKNKYNIYQLALKVATSNNSSVKEAEAAQKLVDELIKRFNYSKKLTSK